MRSDWWLSWRSFFDQIGRYFMDWQNKKINRIIYGMLAYWIFDRSYISLATLVSDVFFFTRSPCRASSF